MQNWALLLHFTTFSTTTYFIYIYIYIYVYNFFWKIFSTSLYVYISFFYDGEHICADWVFSFTRNIYYFLNFPSRIASVSPSLPCDFNKSLGGDMIIYRLSYEFQIVCCLQLLSCSLVWCNVAPFSKRYATW